jgi:hypothetical protein
LRTAGSKILVLGQHFAHAAPFLHEAGNLAAPFCVAPERRTRFGQRE